MDWLPAINEFRSLIEYLRFLKYISDRLEEEEIKEIEPKEYYLGPNRDRRFIDCSNGDIWRLVPPDFPFKGFFEKVKYPLDGYKEERIT